MKIIALSSYRSGYTGIIEEEERYVFFHASRRGTAKTILEYSKADYTNLDHFQSVITKFVPRTFFLAKPLTIQSLTIPELDALEGKTQRVDSLRS